MTPEELARLPGLEHTEPKLVGEQSLPRDDSARGYATESLERIAERLDGEGDVVEVLPAANAIVRHLQWAIGVYFVASSNKLARLDVVRGASFDLGGGDLLVSGREGPAVVRISSPGQKDKAFVLDEGKAELWLLGGSADPTASLSVPDLAVFTQGVAGSPEIEQEFEQLRFSDDVLDRLAAPGLLLRFWIPSDREVRRKQLLAMVLEDAPLLVAVRTWFSSLGEPARSAVTGLAVVATQASGAIFAVLEATEDRTEMHKLTVRAALSRDRLESVRRVLVACGAATELNAAVRALDGIAATHLTQLADAGVDDVRLRRVLATEPDAWWGAIGA